LKDTANAIKSFETTLTLDSTMTDVYSDLAGLYMVTRQYNDAIRIYKKKVSVDPNSAASYVNLALSLIQLKRYDEAQQDLLKALELSPDYIQGYMYLATVYALMDSTEAQQREYEYVLNLIQSDEGKYRKDAQEVYYRLAWLNFSSQKYGIALEFFRKALKAGLDNSDIHLRIGQSIILGRDDTNEDDKRHRCDESTKQFHRAIELDPKNADAHFWLGTALILCRFPGEAPLNKEKTEEAKSEFHKTLQIDPNYKEAKKALERL
jgi:tetratricopeptide (TPR) repeat protein